MRVDRIKFLVTIIWIGIIVFCAISPAAGLEGGACVTCHEFLGGELAEPVAAWKGSIHQQNDITCDLCHGGNADVEVENIAELSGQEFAEKQSLAMSKSHGFIGKPSGKDQFDICAKCHDASVVRYASSIMGEAYLDDKGGPSCIACHQAHHNVIPAVPKVCEGCHKDTTGYSQIDPMSVTAATVNELSRIRTRLAEEKAKGPRPSLAPPFPEELDSYQIGLLAFGAIFVLFLLGYLVYVILEKGKQYEL